MPTPTPIASGPRKYPRLKFVWGSGNVIKGRWRFGLFCFYERVHGFPGSGLALSLRGLLRWAVVLAVAGYLGGAALLTRWFRREPHNQIGFTDVLTWPVRRDHIATLRGRAWLAQGRDALQAKRWAEGIFLLRRGLEQCPEDFEARFTLAQFYLLSGQRTQAFALLAEGPLHGRPSRAWLEAVFSVAAAGEDWTTSLVLCELCLPQMGEPAQWADRQWLLSRKLAALTALGRASEALTLAEAEGDAAISAVKLERAQALLALGRTADAVTFLTHWRGTADAVSKPPLLHVLVRALRESGRLDEMDRALADLRALTPDRPEPLAFAVEQRARAGRNAAAALDDYLLRFGGAPASLQLVVTPLTEIPDVPLVRRVVAAAADRGYQLRPFRVPLAMALLRNGDWDELARIVAAVTPQFAKADAEARQWLDWIQAVSAALVSPQPGAQEQLVAFMRARHISLEAHRLTIEALHRAGRDATARDVLVVSHRLYAESPTLAAQQAEVDRALAAAAVATQSATTAASANKPAAITENWREYFRSLDEAIAASHWTDAQQLAHAARFARPAPGWLAAHDAELTWREVRIAQGAHDPNAFRLNLGLYLDGSATRAAEVVQFARDLHAAGSTDDAQLALKAVLEKSPDHPLATSLLAEWKPRRKTDGK